MYLNFNYNKKIIKKLILDSIFHSYEEEKGMCVNGSPNIKFYPNIKMFNVNLQRKHCTLK